MLVLQLYLKRKVVRLELNLIFAMVNRGTGNLSGIILCT